MKIPVILLDLGTLMLPDSGVDAGGLRWTMGPVGFLSSRTQRGAQIEIWFDVGALEDAMVGVVIDGVLIGGFDSTGELQDARLRAILNGTLPALARHAAELRRAATVLKRRRSDDHEGSQKSALDRL